MSIDRTPQHSWKLAKRYYRSLEHQDGEKFAGVGYVFECVHNQQLENVLFACTSHDSLLISQFRDVPSNKPSLRFSEVDNTVTVEFFDPKKGESVVLFEGAVSDSRRPIEEALSLLVS